jgi:hypothetical protein
LTASNVLRSVSGGFYSNWMDDVTTAFTTGYYLNDFNNYLDNKYDINSVNNSVDFMSNFLAGM